MIDTNDNSKINEFNRLHASPKEPQPSQGAGAKELAEKCGKDVSDGGSHTCRPKQKTPEEMAEEYCDRPRCAQMTRNGKAWHRTKAAYLEAYHAGYDAGFTQRKEWRKDE